MLKFDFIRLNIVPSNNEAYAFTNVCLEFGNRRIGDFSQLVLINTLILSLDDLLDRIENGVVIVGAKNEIAKLFYSYFDDLNKSAIPIFTEAFDGDAGLLFKIDGEEFLIIKKWKERDLIYIKTTHKSYADAIKSCLLYLKKLTF